MNDRSIRTALISSDRDFREMVKDVFLSHEGWTTPALEITAPLDSFGEEQIRALRQLNPELVILDIPRPRSSGSSSPSSSSETAPSVRFIAAGPLLQPEHLLVAMRAGVADYLPKPAGPEVLHGSLDRLQHTLGLGGKAGPKQPGTSCTRSSVPRGAPAPPASPPTSRWCCTGSPASRPCWWTSTWSWARSPSCSGSSRGSTSWTW